MRLVVMGAGGRPIGAAAHLGAERNGAECPGARWRAEHGIDTNCDTNHFREQPGGSGKLCRIMSFCRFAFERGTEGLSSVPFDVQHRKVIRYKTSSPDDFATLSDALTSRLRAIREASQARQTIADLPTDVASHEGFTPHELAALAPIGSHSMMYSNGPGPDEIVGEIGEGGVYETGRRA